MERERDEWLKEETKYSIESFICKMLKQKWRRKKEKNKKKINEGWRYKRNEFQKWEEEKKKRVSFKIHENFIIKAWLIMKIKDRIFTAVKDCLNLITMAAKM